MTIYVKGWYDIMSMFVPLRSFCFVFKVHPWTLNTIRKRKSKFCAFKGWRILSATHEQRDNEYCIKYVDTQYH